MFKDFDTYLSVEPAKNESKFMKKELKHLAYKLKKHNIDSPYEFVNIMSRFNILRPTINEFMKEIVHLQINGFNLSDRLLSKTNAFEKNTILTYQSFFEPFKVMNQFRNFITERYPYFGSKENFFAQIEKEIDKVREKKSIVANNPDKSNSDDSNSDNPNPYNTYPNNPNTNNSNLDNSILSNPHSLSSFSDWQVTIQNEQETDEYFYEYDWESNDNFENDITGIILN